MEFYYEILDYSDSPFIIHIILYFMSSLIDESTTSDFHDIGIRVLTHLKTYSLFIFYQNSHLQASPSLMSLEKLTFRLKDDRVQHSEKNNEINKSVTLNFCDLENELELVNTLQFLKISSQSFKTRIICYCSEATLLSLFIKAKNFAIQVQSIPICLYTSSIHSDFATFLGWGQPNISSLSTLSVILIEKDVRKWVESPTQKIDIWAAEFNVQSQGGRILKIKSEDNRLEQSKQKSHRELFISNLSVGYHPQLMADFQIQKSGQFPTFLNKFKFSLQEIKKFCCVGNSDMKQNTGIIKVDLNDQKGHRHLLKELADRSEFQQIQHRSLNSKDKRKILSLLFSNINRFMGEKIKDSENSRMNDKKLEFFTFKSKSTANKICATSGDIALEFSPERPVSLQINDSYYRLQRPQSLKINYYGKAKVIINKETLSC